MATRSRIGRVMEDGRVKSIYCHWDGYPEHNGEILKNFYNKDNIDELLELGELSILGEKIKPTGEHSFDNPEVNTCVAYHRDRGEEYREPRIDDGVLEFLSFPNDWDIEYKYLLDKENRWFVFGDGSSYLL